jgi:hypothetical protein
MRGLWGRWAPVSVLALIAGTLVSISSPTSAAVAPACEATGPDEASAASGSSFSGPAAWSTVDFVGNLANLIGDINGDGRADLIALSANWTYVMLSTGTSFGPSTAWAGQGMPGTVGNFG